MPASLQGHSSRLFTAVRRLPACLSLSLVAACLVLHSVFLSSPCRPSVCRPFRFLACTVPEPAQDFRKASKRTHPASGACLLLPTRAPVTVCLSRPLPLACGLSPFASLAGLAFHAVCHPHCRHLPQPAVMRLSPIASLGPLGPHFVPSLSPHLICSLPVGSKPTRNAVEHNQYDQPATGRVACMPRAAKTLRGGTFRLTWSPKGRQQNQRLPCTLPLEPP